MSAIHDGMHPNPEAARALAARMDRELVASLDHIAGACRDAGLEVPFDRAAYAAALGAGNSVHPAVYGSHFDLLDAIADSDEGRILNRFAIIASMPQARGLDPVSLDAATLGADIEAIYRRFIDADAGRPLNLVAPEPDVAAGAAARVAEARALMAQAGDFEEEFSAITRQLVMARHRPGAPHGFGGASTFFLWGALFFNAHDYFTPLDLAMTLVHESTHGLLFALAMDEPVTLNDKAARYSSPLRDDPRPMEGIFHATCVIARMHLFLDSVAAAPGVHGETRERAGELAAECLPGFSGGHETIEAHGELSPTGRRLLDAATAHMGRAA